MIDLRACIPVALGWIVLVVVLSVPAGAAGVAGAAIGVAVVAGGAAGVLARSVSGRRRRWAERCAVLLLAAAFVGAVCGSVAVKAAVRSPPSLVEAAEGSAPVVLDGSVTARSEPETGRATMRVDEATTRIGMTRGEVPVLLLGLPAEAPELDVGDRVVVRARLTATAAGDSVAFLARATDVSVVSRASGVVGWADALRAGFRSRAGGLPGDGGALLPGLAIGDTSAVDESLEAAMKGASLTHLTAVSGANCAVVVALVLALGLQLRIPRLVRLGAAAAVLALFVVLVTPEPSVLRAAVMALVAIVLVAAGRPVRPLPLLAVAVGVLLLVDPWLAREYGFALSVLATAGLVVLAGPLARLFARVVPEPVAVALAVPFAAQLACQPLLITLSPSIPVHGLAANVLAEPAAPVATVLGLLACLVGPVWPGGAAVVAAAAWVPAAWIGAVARFCSSLPGRALPWPAEGWSVALLALLVLLVAGVVLTTPYRRSRRVAVVGLLVVAVPTASVVTGSAVGRTLSFPADWSVIQCSTFPVE
ncbi:ComEC/Rec2 family competence protein [Frondihabitans cladoniiphilus]|uniref:ComEC/Rec2-related protein domain-containing protein n=1 Tax=Frondihabitans cladoniiphilus TaxID=715785 RepID=A0ABP8VM85_9MICO